MRPVQAMTAAVAGAVLAVGCASAPAPEAEVPVTSERQAEAISDPVLLPVAQDPTVSVRLAFRAGAQDDPAGKEGLAHLTAAMMAEGATATHAYPEILELLYPMAAGYGVRVDKELTTFSGRAHRETLDAYTDLLLDAILRPAFTEEDFQRLKSRTRDGIAKTLRYSSDEELGKAVLYGSVFAGTPYGHLNQGTLAGLEAITLDDVRAFHREHFTRSNLILGVGGGYEAAYVERLESALAALPAGADAPRPAVEPAPVTGREVLLVAKPGPATAISFGFPVEVTRGERDFYALWLANSWLGEHRNSSSHLYQVIREARGLNYGDYSYIEYYPEGGMREVPPPNVPRREQLFEIWIRPVPNETAHFALRAAVRELEKLHRDGLTREQFELTRDFLSKYVLHFAETTSTRLGYAIDDRFYGLEGGGHLERFRSVLQDLTLQEVNAAIRRYLDPEHLRIAMVTEDAAALAEALKAGTPSPITYETPKPDEVLAEDREIATYPLAIDRVAIVPVEELFER